MNYKITPNGILALVVIYHPDAQLLQRNIEALVSGGIKKILIWRNSDDNLDYLNQSSPYFELIGDTTNCLLAKPMNEALRIAKEQGYKYVLTMDQDSVWENLSGFIDDISRINIDNVGIFAPIFEGDKNDKLSYTEVEFVITSGSLINVKRALDTGGFNERYGIYWVDSEFCHKTRKSGYKIVQLHNHKLEHNLGSQTKTMFGFKTSNYSPQTYYYMFRNMIWEHRQYGNEAVSWKCMLYTTFYNIRGILLGEKNKFKKLRYISKAVAEGMCKPYL